MTNIVVFYQEQVDAIAHCWHGPVLGCRPEHVTITSIVVFYQEEVATIPLLA